MVSTFKVSPERFRHLAQLIQTATKTQDWLGIKRYDLQLRDLLETHQAYLSDPRPVSYTTLTMPTKREGEVSVGAVP